MSVAFGLSKLSFLVPKKGQLSFSERREDLSFRDWTKISLINSRILKFPENIRRDKSFLVQAKINLQSFKSTPDSLKQHLKAFDRKRSLGAPGYCNI